MSYIIKTKKGEVIVNDGIDIYSPQYQQMRLHHKKKRALGERINILRRYLRLWYGEDWIDDEEHHNELENLLDNILQNHNYNLESAIECYSKI